jgi:hypothetical protein
MERRLSNEVLLCIWSAAPLGINSRFGDSGRALKIKIFAFRDFGIPQRVS